MSYRFSFLLNYYPSQTSVDNGFFAARFRDRWFLPAVQKFWSRDNIFAALWLAKHESRDAILIVPESGRLRENRELKRC